MYVYVVSLYFYLLPQYINTEVSPILKELVVVIEVTGEFIS